MRLGLTRALLTLALLPAAAAAQVVPATLPAPRVGLLAGLNSATIRAADDDEDVATDRRNAFVGGAYLALPFARYLAFRPEVLYAQKGATAREDDARVTVKLDYVEVPLLLEATVPTAGGVRPQLYAGPALGYQARCQVQARGGGVSLTSSCDGFVDDPDEDAGRKRFEFSGVVGGALAFGVGAQTLTVGARYTHGFSEVFDESAAKNRAFAVYGSLEFPFGRTRR